MNEWLTLMADSLTQANPLFVLAIVGFVAYLENIVPPIPGDMMVVFAGYLAAAGFLPLVPLYLILVVTSTVGFMSFYFLGKTWGVHLRDPHQHRWFARLINPVYLDKATSWMQRWGEWVVVANRFLAGTRSIISLSAGMLHMPLIPTVAASAVSAALWNALLLIAGWQLQSNWEMFGGWLRTYGKILMILLALFVGWKLWQAYRDRQEVLK